MALIIIKVEVTADHLWLALNGVGLVLDDNGEIAVDMAPGRYILEWEMDGNAGTGFSIEAKLDGTVVSKKWSREIPFPHNRDSGAHIFHIKELAA